jgi:hypothetical protein
VMRKRSGWIPLAVLAAFVAPILLAWWFAIVHPEAVPQQQLNHGDLIHPPIDFSLDPAAQALTAMELAPAEWGLMYFGAGPCAADCTRHIELLTTIRSLLGAQGARVHVAALLDDPPAAAIDQVVMIVDAGLRSTLAREILARTGRAGDSGIVILDSRHLAMMSFPLDAQPADIKADLKRLLRGSAIH